MNKVLDKLKELYTYINVDIDKEFAIELIPIVELVLMDTAIIKKLAGHELSFIEKIYVKCCESKNKQNNLYNTILDKADKIVRYKVLTLLDCLYDIMKEDSPSWNTRWKIKCYYKIKYDEVQSDFGIILEPKPEYLEKEKKNEEIRKYNLKQRKKCQKWRNSNIKFYKNILKIVNN